MTAPGEDNAWVERTLVEYERARSAARVLSLSEEEAVSVGDNYQSILKRLRLSVLSHSGGVTERTLILKSMPLDSPYRLVFVKGSGSFTKEVKVYRDVLSEMEELMKLKERGAETLWPQFYGSRRRCEALLFEDLTESGYKMADRQKALDMEHAKLAIQSLAKFHALGAVLKERGDLTAMEYASVFEQMPEMIDVFFKKTLLELVGQIENTWPEEWKGSSEKIHQFADRLTSLSATVFKRKDTHFYTLNHGDFWTNNMLFKYAPDGRPTSLKFIDFQQSYLHNPGLDLQYFFQTSLNLEARTEKKLLLDHYHAALVENLELYGFNGKRPSMEEIQEQYCCAGPFGVLVALSTMPAMLMPPGKVPDMDELSEKWAKQEDTSFGLYDDLKEGGLILKLLKFSIKEAEDNGLL